MNLMEMVMAMLATVLFTTLSLTYNRALFRQTDFVNNATIVVQASQLCHAVLDEADAKLFSKQISVDQLLTKYNYSKSVTYPHLPETFIIKAEAVDCDSLGVEIDYASFEDEEVYASLFKRITVTVSGPNALKYPYKMSRLYTRTFM